MTERVVLGGLPVRGSEPLVSSAIRWGDLLFLSGRAPVVPETLALTHEDFDGQARFVLDTIVESLREAGTGPEHVLRVECWLASAADFDAWVARQQAPPAEPADLAAEGKAVYTASACVGCHTVRGVSAGVLGPDLTHFGSRTMLAAGMWPNTPENVAEWVKDPQRLKPGVKMPDLGLTDQQAKALATYLTSLK